MVPDPTPGATLGAYGFRITCACTFRFKDYIFRPDQILIDRGVSIRYAKIPEYSARRAQEA